MVTWLLTKYASMSPHIPHQSAKQNLVLCKHRYYIISILCVVCNIYGACKLWLFSNWFPYGHNGIRTLDKTFGGNFAHVVCVLATKTQYSPTVNVNEEAELTDMDRVKCSHGRWTMPNRLSCHVKCLPFIFYFLPVFPSSHRRWLHAQDGNKTRPELWPQLLLVSQTFERAVQILEGDKVSRPLHKFEASPTHIHQIIAPTPPGGSS